MYLVKYCHFVLLLSFLSSPLDGRADTFIECFSKIFGLSPSYSSANLNLSSSFGKTENSLKLLAGENVISQNNIKVGFYFPEEDVRGKKKRDIVIDTINEVAAEFSDRVGILFHYRGYRQSPDIHFSSLGTEQNITDFYDTLIARLPDELKEFGENLKEAKTSLSDANSVFKGQPLEIVSGKLTVKVAFRKRRLFKDALSEFQNSTDSLLLIYHEPGSKFNIQFSGSDTDYERLLDIVREYGSSATPGII